MSKISLKSYLTSVLLVAFCLFPVNNLHGDTEGFVLSAPELEDRNKVTSIDKKEMHCITRLLWYEARGESHEAIKAVLSVVKNRTVHPKFPSSYCKVEQQPKQFSYFRKGRSYEIKPKDSNEKKKLDFIRDLAYDAVSEKFQGDLPRNVIFYMNFKLNPKLHLKDVKTFGKIGTHKFYAEANIN